MIGIFLCCLALTWIAVQFATAKPRRVKMTQLRATQLLRHGCKFITTPKYTPGDYQPLNTARSNRWK